MRGVKVNGSKVGLDGLCVIMVFSIINMQKKYLYIINRATRRRKSIPISTFPVSSAALPTAQFL